MRVLLLSKYDTLGASSRLRTLQYLPSLREAGIEVEVRPLLDDRYVESMYAGHASVASVIVGYARRLRALLDSRNFDVLWVEKECLPWLPAFLELALLPRQIKLLVDYDDALFHRYDRHCSALVRMLLGHKIDTVMKRADLVIAGNDYLAEHALAAGSRDVARVPTVIDLRRYPEEGDRVAGPEIVIGWIGSPATTPYLCALAPAIEALRKRHAIRCIAIGALARDVADLPFEVMEWSEQGEFELLKRLDIGVMPLSDSPWEQGKCGYKLIQYMACGIPVVASPTRANADIVMQGECGYLAASTQEWIEALERLISDSSLRRGLGGAGRRAVERTYSLQVQAPRLLRMLNALVTGHQT